MSKNHRKVNIAFLVVLAMMLLSLCACQTDFSRPADYVFDAKNSERTYTLDLSGMNLPGTSKTFAFEVKNTSGSEKEYNLTALLVGTLPLNCEFAPETENENTGTADGATATGTIGKNEKHRYTLTVSWSAEDNSYIYAGGVALVTVEGFAE